MEDQNQVPSQEQANQEVPAQEEETQVSKKAKILNWIKIIAFLCVVIALVTFVSIEWDMVSDWLADFLEWVEEVEFLGMLVFALVYMVATVLFVPGLILTLGAGFIYASIYGPGIGVLVGTIVVFIGATAGAILAMLLGRYVFRQSLSQKVKKYPKFLAIEEAINEEGFKLTALLRLSPLIPFNALNYFMGITSVKFKDYSLACIGMLPGTTAYVYFGSALSSVSDAAGGSVEGGVLELVLLVVGSVLAIVAVVYVSIIAKRKINALVEKNKSQPAQEV